MPRFRTAKNILYILLLTGELLRVVTEANFVEFFALSILHSVGTRSIEIDEKKLSELTPRITTSSPVNQLLELLTIRKKKGIPIELFICLLKCASVFKSHAVEHDCLSTKKDCPLLFQ